MPWVVVLLGVGLLVALLLFALVSFRGSEQQAVPAPAPPLMLPTLPATVAPSPSETPEDLVTATLATPSARATSRPSVAASDQPVVRGSGRMSARYSVQDSDRNSFEASLVVRNGADRASDWRVELLFTGNVKSMQASSDSGVSVSTNGSGWYVLRGTGPLDAGESQTVSLRVGRNGTGERPGQCTVNGADCVIG
ncbi:cellulose binding domain-containing protein [Micromonospora phytophila]|uniref:cellulose binding domain-containing protein n=1 Tax=Micromonospora phytophila TaxID=709888 RepID=UPI00203084B6|nr:cellulose binding domain-containing protein [Micromonospora phytophila]MCM0674375.1 cellulose binding domain-containing protein [Micromonospora phytophila]